MAEQDQSDIVREGDLVKLGRFFFEKFCEEQNIAMADRPAASFRDFFTALSPLTASWTPETLAEEVGTTLSSAGFMLQTVYEQRGPAALSTLWPFIILAWRENKHMVRSMNLLAAIQFTDGVLVPVNLLVHSDITVEPLNDMHLAHLVYSRTPDLASPIMLQGCDVLHDKYEDKFYGATNQKTVDILRKLVCAAPSDDGLISGNDYRITNADREKLLRLVKFVEQLFPVEISEEIKAQFAAVKKSGAKK